MIETKIRLKIALKVRDNEMFVCFNATFMILEKRKKL